MVEENNADATAEEVVEVEITGEGKEAKAVKVETKPEPEAAPAKQSSDKDDELADYSLDVRRRIEKLTFKMREAERREQAALEYAKSVKNQMDVANIRTAQIDLTLSNEAENRVKLQEQLIKDKLRVAIDRGDIDGQVQLQRDLAELAVENDRVRYNRARSEAQSQEVYRQATAPQPQVQQQAPRRPDPKAETWAEKNTWFGSDEPMTITAFSHHKSLVEREGFDPTSDDYYDELDKRMRRDFPHKFQQQRSPTQTVGSARSSARPDNPSRIRLTPSQVAIAKKLGISVEQYARQVKLLGESNDR